VGMGPGTAGAHAEKNSTAEVTNTLVKKGYCFMGHFLSIGNCHFFETATVCRKLLSIHRG
jgi:hypothetical protein